MPSGTAPGDGDAQRRPRILVLPTYAEAQAANVRTTARLALAHGLRPVVVCNSVAAAAELEQEDWAVSRQGNTGYGGAANAVAVEHDFESLVICNDDLVFTEPAMEALARAADLAPPGAVVGFLPGDDPRLQPQPGLGGVLALVSGLSALTRRYEARRLRRKGVQATPAQDTGVRELPEGVGFPFVCVIITRPAWDVLGGFDTRFPLYFEDVDMLARAHRSGRVRVMTATGPCRHRRSATSRTVLGNILPLMAFGARNYLHVHRGLPTAVASAWVTLGLLCRAVCWLPFRRERRTEADAVLRSLRAVWSSEAPPMPPWS